jgi:paraquat-inducible protein B
VESEIPAGAPVLFRNVQVGEVTRSQLATDHSHVETEIFVLAPHDEYVRQNSRFWNASGVNLKLSAAGLELDTGSLVSIITGGIAFDTPDSRNSAERAPADTEFTLFRSRQQSEETEITLAIPYILEFQESVRGLAPGAPVEFRGMRLGTVKKIEFNPLLETGDSFIAVYIDLELQRIPIYPDRTPPPEAGTADRLARWVQKGLRARLQTGNLLTGALFVELDMHPDAEQAIIRFDEQNIPILPTIPGQLAGITESVSRILHKLEALPIDEIGRNLEETTAGANQLINSGELKQTVEALKAAADKLAPLLDSVTRVSSETETLTRVSTAAMQKADATLSALDSVASGDGPLGSQMVRTLEELRSAVRAIKIMAEYLERHPEALLKGKSGQ